MLDRSEIYQRAQAACGLAVGDYVKINRKCADFFGGWDNKWVPDMNITIGTIRRIVAIKKTGIQLDNGFIYPFFVLEQVEKPGEEPQKSVSRFKPFDRVLVRDYPSQDWKADIFSHYSGKGDYIYVAASNSWRYCIPYEGNEHLLGTTKEPE